MPLRWLHRLLTVTTLAVAGLGAEALLAPAATTTAFLANYSYDH